MTANTHHTKLKGDIAVAAVIFDLTKRRATEDNLIFKLITFNKIY